MTGGYIRKHHHPSSLRVFSLQLSKKGKVNIEYLDEIYEKLSESKIQKCSKHCEAYINKWCEAIGKIPNLEKDCEAQLISRRER